MDSLNQLENLLKNPTSDPHEHNRAIETAFYAIPRIDEQLPISISDGRDTTTLSEFVMACGRCDKNLSNSQVRGRVSQQIKNVASIVTFSYCKDCVLITSNNARVRADQTVNFLTKNGWVTAVEPPQKNFASRLASALFQIFR